MMYALDLVDVKKSFTLHLQGGLHLPVVAGVNFAVQPGECVALTGPSGCGKSSILKMIFGGYRCDGGRILIRDGERTVDIATVPVATGEVTSWTVRFSRPAFFSRLLACAMSCTRCSEVS